MTELEYKNELSRLRSEARKDQEKLAIRYAEINNPYKVGDIIEDHYQIIKIESWKTEIPYGNNMPALVYYGTGLTKSLKPKKRQSNYTMYQTNIKRKIQ